MMLSLLTFSGLYDIMTARAVSRMTKWKGIMLRILSSVCNFSACGILFISTTFEYKVPWFYLCALGVYGTILALEAGRVEGKDANEGEPGILKSICFVSNFIVWCVPVMYAWGFLAITVSIVAAIAVYTAILIALVQGVIYFVRFIFSFIKRRKIKSPKEIEIERVLYNAQYFFKEKGSCLCPNCKATIHKESGCVCSCGFDLYLGRVENPFDRLTRPLRNNRKGVVRMLLTLLFLLLCGVAPFICYVISEKYTYFFPFLAGVLVTTLIVEISFAIKRL